jgi:UDP-glucose 4-epimerase
VQCPIFNGGSGVAVKVRDIVALLSQSLQRPKHVKFSGISRRGDPIVLVADTARIGSTGISCRIPMNSGIERYADWFKLARNE